MMMPDAALTEHVAALRAEIRVVENAQRPTEEGLGERLAELDDAVAQFRTNPFRLPTVGYGAPFDQRLVERGMLAMAGMLQPKLAREAIEKPVRQSCAGPGMRLSTSDKMARLHDLAAQLRVAEALLEVDRRGIESLT